MHLDLWNELFNYFTYSCTALLITLERFIANKREYFSKRIERDNNLKIYNTGKDLKLLDHGE